MACDADPTRKIMAGGQARVLRKCPKDDDCENGRKRRQACQLLHDEPRSRSGPIHHGENGADKISTTSLRQGPGGFISRNVRLGPQPATVEDCTRAGARLLPAPTAETQHRCSACLRPSLGMIPKTTAPNGIGMALTCSAGPSMIHAAPQVQPKYKTAGGISLMSPTPKPFKR